MDIKEQKKEIRKAVKALKNSTPQQERDACSLSIQQKLLSTGIFEQAGTILLYHALPDEVNTELLLSTLSNHRGGNKRIILPVVEGEYLILKEYVPQEMECGYRNISEPTGSVQTDPSEIELAIIPGVAFDKCCNRMGRGKGFYDRLIPYLKCPTIGLGFGFQMVDSIPCEEFDKPLDMVVTEIGTYKRG
jgi:5-formyltetrahydrofolate cyclo-ligase